jgi:hypothetical protein
MLGTDCMFFSLRSKGNVQCEGIHVSTHKAYGEIYIASLIRDFGTRSRFRPRPLYSRAKISLVSTEEVAGWALDPDSTLGKETITFCNQSNHEYALLQLVTYTLCRVRYPGLPLSHTNHFCYTVAIDIKYCIYTVEHSDNVLLILQK